MFERGKKDEDFPATSDDDSASAKSSVERAASAPRARSAGGAVIGRSIKMDGDLRGDEDLRIEGDVSGTVELRSNDLTIGKEGTVRADVYAKSIAVDGKTEGDLYATECVTVHVNARVRGNIVAPKVSIEEGARFKGSIEMDPAAVEKALGKAAPPAPETKAERSESGKSSPSKAAPKQTAKESAAGLNPPSGSA